MNIIKRYVVIEHGFFLCQYPEIIQIITRDNPFYFGADIVFAVMWFWFLSYMQFGIIYVFVPLFCGRLTCFRIYHYSDSTDACTAVEIDDACVRMT